MITEKIPMLKYKRKPVSANVGSAFVATRSSANVALADANPFVADVELISGYAEAWLNGPARAALLAGRRADASNPAMRNWNDRLKSLRLIAGPMLRPIFRSLVRFTPAQRLIGMIKETR